MLAVYISVTCEAYKHNTHLKHGQGGIFPGKGVRIFPGSIEISQEILVENPALCSFLKSSHTNMFFLHKKEFHVTRIIFPSRNGFFYATEIMFCQITYFWHLSKFTHFRANSVRENKSSQEVKNLIPL